MATTTNAQGGGTSPDGREPAPPGIPARASAEPPERTRRAPTALGAAVAMTLPLGTVYAFSVILRPLEAELAASRVELSLVFGLAIVAFRAGMNLAPALHRARRPGRWCCRRSESDPVAG